MHTTFRTLFLSHQHAPVEIREMFVFNKEDIKSLLLSLKIDIQLSEILILSTCNRTEVYYLSEQDWSNEILTIVSNYKNTDPQFAKKYFSILNEHTSSIKHLFEVSVGLDAKVMGDRQISGQVKTAYELSVEMETAGAFLHKLMQTILFTNKRITKETNYRSGSASVSFATVELIEKLIQQKENTNILIIGLGKMGADVFKTLVEIGFSNIILINRTISKTEELAASLSAKCNITSATIEELYTYIKKAEVIVSAAETKEPIITYQELQKYDFLSHKFFIDLSVPRNVENRIEEIPGVLVFNIDDLQMSTTEVYKKREQAIPEVTQIIGESILDFMDWCESAKAAGIIQKMRDSLDQIREEEIDRYKRKLNAESRELVELLTKNIVQKIIKTPVLKLKEACLKGESEDIIRILNSVFDLNKSEKIIKSQ